MRKLFQIKHFYTVFHNFIFIENFFFKNFFFSKNFMRIISQKNFLAKFPEKFFKNLFPKKNSEIFPKIFPANFCREKISGNFFKKFFPKKFQTNIFSENYFREKHLLGKRFPEKYLLEKIFTGKIFSKVKLFFSLKYLQFLFPIIYKFIVSTLYTPVLIWNCWHKINSHAYLPQILILLNKILYQN